MHTRVLWFSCIALAALGCQEAAESPSEPSLAAPEPQTAVATATALSFRQISSGIYHTCAVTSDNRAYCWGNGVALGDGTLQAHLTPVAVSGGLRFREVRTGLNYSCGLAMDSLAYCWGNNGEGQLGDGTTSVRAAPVAVAGRRRFAKLDAGYSHACAVTAVNVAFCWGWNGNGQLGDGTTTNRPTPIRVASGLRFKHVRAGTQHSCGVTTQNRAYCWGSNLDGQLGDGTRTQRLAPVAVLGGHTFVLVAAGNQHSCGVTSDQVAFCWGRNVRGALGIGFVSTYRARPVRVVGDLHFSGVSPGGEHTCGVTTTGRTYCWGWDYYGELGDGATGVSRTAPVAVAGTVQFNRVSAGSLHTCGLTSAGLAYCWGWNTAGQLGDGTRSDRSTPGAVLPPT
jgi:alpha-tubulin suppressor-like RCC1 family protein